jgi:hypothetical protein
VLLDVVLRDEVWDYCRICVRVCTSTVRRGEDEVGYTILDGSIHKVFALFLFVLAEGLWDYLAKPNGQSLKRAHLNAVDPPDWGLRRFSGCLEYLIDRIKVSSD